VKHNKLKYDDHLEDIPEPEKSDQDSNANYLFTSGHCLPNQLLYSISFSPGCEIKASEPGCEVFKIGMKSAGFMKELFQP
jgi:hypothetical protein